MNPTQEALAALRRAALNLETATTALHPNGLDRAWAACQTAYQHVLDVKAATEKDRWTT